VQRLNLTDSQQRDALTYEPGQIVEFHRMAKGAVRRGVQEKRFAAVRTYANFRGTSSERSWLCGILKNKICDHFRKLAQEVSFTDLGFLEDEMSYKFIDQGWNHDLGPAEWRADPEAALDRKEFWETFRSCLDKLPQRVADVFMLREIEQMDTAQICEALRISQNNLWVMLIAIRAL
jgi:RNA polymerase sigma-70 factor (ECF subfamily)